MTSEKAFQFLRDSIYTVVGKLDTEVWVNAEPVPFRDRKSGKYMKLQERDKWGSLFDCGWFHFTGQAPQFDSQETPVLLIDVSGELLLFDEKGRALRGLTNKSSTFDRSLGAPAKRVFRLPNNISSGESIDYWADAGCNDLFGESKDNGTLIQADIAFCNDEIRRLYYDFEFLINLMKGAPAGTERKEEIRIVLERLTTLLSENSLTEARSILEDFFKPMPPHSGLKISAIGHSHLDLAWLWPIRETRRKIGRTISTVLELMEHYPNYIYGISQPQLLVWLKADYPDLFQRLKQKVREGRIEAQGAMWVESDTNLPSGESIVRQILYGKNFWNDEFGLHIDNLWLPDVFGYSGVLPQILKLTGVKYFSTMKLSWNTVNRFPFHSFHWKGLDGSTVLTHMLPEETYNSPANPGSVFKIINNYHERDISNRALMVFGIGDGGGGPGAEHLERLDRLSRISEPASVKQEKLSDFFPEWASQSDKFPTWDGELYLEKHQGTYTSVGLSKWYNRKMELSLRKMEISSIFAVLSSGREYPAKTLEALWKEVLLYQFHDILPGSSIERVYKESWARYAVLLSDTTQFVQNLEKDLIRSAAAISGETETGNGEKKSIVGFNYLSWEVSKWVSLNKQWVKITIPSMGYAVHAIESDQSYKTEFKWDHRSMENQLISLQFAEDGSLLSVYNKADQYEVLKSGEKGNRLTIYEDTGDAWDFPADYRDTDMEHFALEKSDIDINGPELINHQVYRYQESILSQDIVLTADSCQIDFRTRISWCSPEKMLRTSFPVHVPSGKAFCEIQFGAVERPVHSDTRWDLAKDEIAAHSWIDISNGSYGAALLNDSKYGHRVKDRILDLCLLRCVPYPGPVHGWTDLGEHQFTYSLYPHTGDYSEGGVVQAAHELNSPPSIHRIEKTDRDFSRSLFTTGNRSIVISAIKKSEKSDDVIVRLYESAGKASRSWLASDILNFTAQAAQVNLLEEFMHELPIKDGRIYLDFHPYEIISIRYPLNGCSDTSGKSAVM